jgi:uncharacterized membrane protein YbhN (UPF0104 family)
VSSAAPASRLSLGPLLRRLARWIREAERRPLALSLLAGGVAVGVTIGMAVVAGTDRTEAALKGVEPLWLIMIVAGQVVSYAGFYAAYQGTVTSPGGARLPPGLAFKLVAFGSAASSLLGGYSVDRRALQAAGATRSDAGVRVMTMSALEYAVLALAAWASSLALLGDAHVRKAVSIPWAIGFPVGCLVAAWIHLRVRSPGAGAQGSLRRSVGMTLDALTLLADQVRHPIRHRAAWVGIVLHWGGDLAIMWAALRAVGVEPSLPVILLGYATGYALSPRSLPLAGVGVTEALMPLALSWVGVPLPSAVVAVFLYRGGRLVVSVPPALMARSDVIRLLRRQQQQQQQ